eukprot:2397072-Rhodomonas_salina.2
MKRPKAKLVKNLISGLYPCLSCLTKCKKLQFPCSLFADWFGFAAVCLHGGAVLMSCMVLHSRYVVVLYRPGVWS